MSPVWLSAWTACLLVAVGGIAIIAATLLVAPIHVVLDADLPAAAVERRAFVTTSTPTGSPVHVTIRWLGFEWQPGHTSDHAARPSRAGPHSHTTRPSRTSRGRGWRRLRAAFMAPGFGRRLVRLGLDLVRALAPRSVSGWIRLGASDPADTGIMLALWLSAVQPLMRQRVSAWHVRVEPDFLAPSFATSLRATWVVRPSAVLTPVVAFVLSPITWRAGVLALRAH